jgi:hypothetical protein
MVFKGNGIVWDKERNKALCEFKNGVFETEDERTIKLLKEIYPDEIKEIEPIKEEIKEPINKTPPMKIKR